MKMKSMAAGLLAWIWWILFAVALTFTAPTMLETYVRSQARPIMPNVDMIPINDSGWFDGIGTGACARIQMEVRGQMVVWRLQDGRVAVVAVLVSEGVTMVMDDFDLDGRVDRIETIPAGTGTINEDFERVEACR